MTDLPMSDAVPSGEKDHFRARAAALGWVGATNTTKWNELISWVRELTDWQPPYRSRCVTGPISPWDSEWFYHLPFPFSSVRWLDMQLHEQQRVGRLLPPKTIDHSPLMLPVIERIGFEFEVRAGVVRLWG